MDIFGVTQTKQLHNSILCLCNTLREQCKGVELSGQNPELRMAQPKGMILAQQLTVDSLDRAIAEWQSRTQESEIELVCFGAHSTEQTFFRNETWGGQGAQPFRLGDWIVADVQPLVAGGDKEQSVVVKRTGSGSSEKMITRYES